MPAEATGRSKPWVKKWMKRIRNSPLEDQEVLHGRSRSRKHPPPGMADEVMERILEIRDYPPEKLGWILGPLTILYYLQHDQDLAESGVELPRPTGTIWKIVDHHLEVMAIVRQVFPLDTLPSRA
jgi:hypothetical protein